MKEQKILPIDKLLEDFHKWEDYYSEHYSLDTEEWDKYAVKVDLERFQENAISNFKDTYELDSFFIDIFSWISKGVPYRYMSSVDYIMSKPELFDYLRKKYLDKIEFKFNSEEHVDLLNGKFL